MEVQVARWKLVWKLIFTNMLSGFAGFVVLFGYMVWVEPHLVTVRGGEWPLTRIVLFFVAGFGGGVLSSLLMYFLTMKFLSSLESTIATAESVAHGDFSIGRVFAADDEESGRIANAMQEIVNKMRTIVELLKKIADGDFTYAVRPEDAGEMTKMLEQTVEALKRLIVQVKNTSSQVASASAEILTVSERMEEGIRKQAEQAAKVARVAEDLATSVIEVAQSSRNVVNNSKEALNSSTAAKEAAAKGGAVVSSTIERMTHIAAVVVQMSEKISSLDKRSQEIGAIIEVINDISDQTSLLALNAAIEAARAGEHGRSFAVVAEEVRRLADRTADATASVTDRIEEIQRQTSEVVTAMGEWKKQVEEGSAQAAGAGSALKVIVDHSGGVQTMVHHIVAATEEQTQATDDMSRNIEGITRSIDQIAMVSQDAAVGANEVKRSAADLARLTEDLLHLTERFKT
ncbi:MAG: methyl-accepting chemotaxis protein [Planctomycetota bacterium]